MYTRSNDDRITKFSSIMGSHLYTTVSLIIISGGGTIIFLSFLGCCGAIKEVKCMLGTVTLPNSLILYFYVSIFIYVQSDILTVCCTLPILAKLSHEIAATFYVSSLIYCMK